MSADLLRDLARAKTVFQLRAIRAAEACGNALRRSLANACRQKGTRGWTHLR